MLSQDNGKTESLKYGTFRISDGIAYWEQDPDIKIKTGDSASAHCYLEGFWKPEGCKNPDEYNVAVTGMCIWGEHDCVFRFMPLCKGNSGATRSLANPKEHKDLLKRVSNGQKVEKVSISENPFGDYHLRLLGWQADSVSFYGIKKLYYALPVDEYMVTLSKLKKHFPVKCVDEISHKLHDHYKQLKEKITETIDAEVEFIHPMRLGKMTQTESYTWPYRNLDIDLGIEEMNEIRIVYQAMKEGAAIPPVLLGILKIPDPYNDPRENDTRLTLIP